MHCCTASVTVDPNAAVRFLTGAIRDHISPVLRSLHWLPMKQRVDYKLATLVYKSLRGRPQLRSAHANVLTVPRTNTQLGDRSFLSRVREFGTVPPHCDSLTLNLDTLNDL